MIPFRFHIAILLALLTAVPMSRYPENQKVRKPAAAEDDHLFHFSAEEKRAMLAVARASILFRAQRALK